MSDEEPALPAGARASRKPLVLIGAVALVLGLGGGFGGATLMAGPAEAAEEGAAEHGATPEPEEAAAGHGEAKPEAAAGGHGAAEGKGPELKVSAEGTVMIPMGAPFTLNLRGSGGGRVLRMDVQIEGSAADAESITVRIPQIRDTILVATSDYSWSELEGTDGKTRLRDELLARVNGVVTPTHISRLYFTQFVVQ